MSETTFPDAIRDVARRRVVSHESSRTLLAAADHMEFLEEEIERLENHLGLDRPEKQA